MIPPVELRCPSHQSALAQADDGSAWRCPSGCSYPVVDGIVRFVPADNYASAFGLQWNTYRLTQLDSHTGVPISRDRLQRMLGGSFDAVKGKLVLEAGCGAGRFTEVLLAEGARVFAVDLSSAVEANLRNCGSHQDYFVCQANILAIPVPPEQFDVVICAGVIQHTPDPAATVAALSRHVKPGGLLVIDHYTHRAFHVTRSILRYLLIRAPRPFALRSCQIITDMLWPVHRFLYTHRASVIWRFANKLFRRISPVFDYQEMYPELGDERLRIWAMLDTHDGLTDYYKHLKTADEVRGFLEACGMTSIEAVYAGNGVEARARKREG